MSKPTRRGVRVHLENGDHFDTEINGTQRSIHEYYMGKTFNVGREGDNMQKVINLEFIDHTTGTCIDDVCEDDILWEDVRE